MADKGIASVSSSVFMDDIKSSIGGNLSYEPADATEKWAFLEKSISNSSGDVFGTIHYLGSATDELHANDIIKWFCIKNVSTTLTDGIAICTNAGTAVWNGAESIIIGPGEMFVCKPSSACSVADLHAISVTMDATGNYATGTHSGSVTAQCAAIIDDVA
tara:strand:+ start:442 stop:921 length:480 start_codon:yes stop_codon:yes gene_type:complete